MPSSPPGAADEDSSVSQAYNGTLSYTHVSALSTERLFSCPAKQYALTQSHLSTCKRSNANAADKSAEEMNSIPANTTKCNIPPMCRAKPPVPRAKSVSVYRSRRSVSWFPQRGFTLSLTDTELSFPPLEFLFTFGERNQTRYRPA